MRRMQLNCIFGIPRVGTEIFGTIRNDSMAPQEISHEEINPNFGDQNNIYATSCRPFLISQLLSDPRRTKQALSQQSRSVSTMSAPILYMQNFSGPVRSVLLTAQALGLTLSKKIVDLSKREHLTEEYLKLNPQHTIPTLVDDGFVIWDSHAINAYLVDKYGKDDSLYPKDLAKRALVNQRLHFDGEAVFFWLRNISRAIKYKGLKSLTEDQIEGITNGYDFLEKFLGDKKWVAGDELSIADFSLIANVTSLDFFLPLDQRKYPNIVGWIGRGELLPYYNENAEGLQSFKGMFKDIFQ